MTTVTTLFDKLKEDRDLEVSWIYDVAVQRLGEPGVGLFDGGTQEGVVFELARPCDLEGLALLEVSFVEAQGVMRFAFGPDRDELATVLYLYPRFEDSPKLIRAASESRLWVSTVEGMLEVPVSPQATSQLTAATYAARYWLGVTRRARLN